MEFQKKARFKTPDELFSEANDWVGKLDPIKKNEFFAYMRKAGLTVTEAWEFALSKGFPENPLPAGGLE